MQSRSRLLSALILTVAFTCSGCDETSGAPRASSSTTQAKVKGRVTLKGKPLAKAEIQFNPANVHRKTAPVVATTIDDDGNYEVTTLVGENTITLGGRVLRKNVQLQYTARTLEVKEGDNTYDLPLP